VSTTIGLELDDETRARLQHCFDFLADVTPPAAAKAIRLIRSGAD
jgi:plasmid stabilization system protein ParE